MPGVNKPIIIMNIYIATFPKLGNFGKIGGITIILHVLWI